MAGFAMWAGDAGHAVCEGILHLAQTAQRLAQRWMRIARWPETLWPRVPVDMEPDLRGRRAAAEQAHRWPEREARTSYAGTPARRSHAPRRWAVSSRGYLGVSHSERARTQRCTRCATASPGMASPIRYEAYGSVLYAASKTGGIVLATVCWHKRDDGAPSSVSGRPLASDATRGCSHTVVVTAGRPCHAATLSLCRTCPRMHPGGPAAAPQACVDPPGKRGPP
jgi:hypothetical protein